MRFRSSLRAGLIAAGLVAAAAAAPARTDATTYNLTLSGIPLGTVTLEAEQSGDTYVAVSRITPNGFVSAVTGYSFDGRARGSIDASGKVTPRLFEADSTSPRAKRRTEIEWRGDTPVRVSVVPPRNYAPDPDRIVGALDPVSAGFALLRDNAAGAICDTSIDVFDGSRRSRLSLGKPVAGAGGAVTCAGVYAKLEGESHSFSPQAEYPFTVTFAPGGDGRMRLERIETETRFGNAVVSRRG
jgi:hypothetical protein